MSYVDASAQSSDATQWCADRLAEQGAAHHGAALRAWAEEVLPQLPAGPVALMSTSVEGCALAAVVSALRTDETTWERLNLGRPEPQGRGSVVILEAVRLSAGVIAALGRLLPEALVLEGLAASESVLATAA